MGKTLNMVLDPLNFHGTPEKSTPAPVAEPTARPDPVTIDPRIAEEKAAVARRKRINAQRQVGQTETARSGDTGVAIPGRRT